MVARINFSEAQIQEMYRLRSQEKMPYDEIGRLFGVSKQTVDRRMKEYVNKNGLSENSLSLDHQFDKFFFHDIDTPEKAYWLGFITADGHLNEEQTLLSIRLSSIDHHHLEKFLKAIQSKDIPIHTEIHNITGNCLSFVFVCGKEFAEGLKKQGIEQRKSQHEKPPIIEEKFFRDFIRGLWDGDGYVSDRKIGLCSSYEMCKWIQLQLHRYCETPINKIGFDSNVYRLNVTKTQIDVLKWMYYPGCKEMALDRKYKAAKLKILRSIKKNHLKNINDKMRAAQSGNTLEIMNGELNGKLPLGQSEIEGAA